MLGVKPNDKLLDVACGAGALLQRGGQEVNGWGVDLSERAIRLARRVASHANLSVGDMQRMPYGDGCFDYVTNIGGLEHVPDMQQALREMARVCADDGKLCIVVPNSEFFWYRVLRMEGTRQAVMEEHLMALTEWQDLVRDTGLCVIRIEADPGPDIRTGFGLKVFIRGVLRRMALAATAFMPITSTYQFVFICSKSAEYESNHAKKA
jgi:SAM-dependent methyltransferase